MTDTSTTQDHRELVRRLAMLLDGCLELLDEAAERERRREEGKAMRQITMQQRAETARGLIREAEEALEGGE